MVSRTESVSISVVGDNQTYVENLVHPVIKTRAGDFIYPDVEASADLDYGTHIFNYEFVEGLDRIGFTAPVQVEVTYHLKDSLDGVRKEIDEETYELLPTVLQSLYRKQVETGSEFTLCSGDVEVVSLVDYAEKNASLRVYPPNTVIEKLLKLNFAGVNKRAMVEKVGSWDKAELKVVFFSEDYDNKMKKVLSKKSNGHPYADRRGRYVPDYPTVLDTILIPAGMIPTIVGSNQEEADEKLQQYFDHLTMTHLLTGGK